MDSSKLTDMGQVAYEAYGRAVNFQNYQGHGMPGWLELPPKIQDAWREATKAAISQSVPYGVGPGRELLNALNAVAVASSALINSIARGDGVMVSRHTFVVLGRALDVLHEAEIGPIENEGD